MKPLLNCKKTASFNLYFEKINFSTGVGGSLSYFVEIPEGWGGGGGHQFLTNMEIPGMWGGPK